jgi:hypothetical protein
MKRTSCCSLEKSLGLESREPGCVAEGLGLLSYKEVALSQIYRLQKAVTGARALQPKKWLITFGCVLRC